MNRMFWARFIAILPVFLFSVGNLLAKEYELTEVKPDPNVVFVNKMCSFDNLLVIALVNIDSTEKAIALAFNLQCIDSPRNQEQIFYVLNKARIFYFLKQSREIEIDEKNCGKFSSLISDLAYWVQHRGLYTYEDFGTTQTEFAKIEREIEVCKRKEKDSPILTPEIIDKILRGK